MANLRKEHKLTLIRISSFVSVFLHYLLEGYSAIMVFDTQELDVH